MAIAIFLTLSASPVATSASLKDLIRANPECAQFNDGCSICKVDSGETTCSMPGFACINKGWKCAYSVSDKSSTEGGGTN
jgi:hypothetical protein